MPLLSQRKRFQGLIFLLLFTFLPNKKLVGQADAPPLPPPTMPQSPPSNPSPFPAPGPAPAIPPSPIYAPGASGPIVGTPIPDQAPIGGQGTGGILSPAAVSPSPTAPASGGLSGMLRRLPDPTANKPISPSQTDLGGLLVPNLLPGVTGPEYKEGEKPIVIPGAEPVQRDGFYFTQDLYILQPNFIGTLQLSPALAPWNGGILTQPAPFTTLVFPTTALEWVVSPTFDFGYRLPGKQGEFALTYQFLVSQGSGTGSYYGLNSQVNSRITQNEVDLLYRSFPTALGPRFEFRYEIGAKLGFFFYDSLAANAYGQGHATNYFYGGGPRFRMDGDFALTRNRRWFFTNGVEISALMGQIQQSFSNSVVIPGQTPYVFAVSAPLGTTTLPVFKYQTGVRWTPAFTEGLSLMAGFELNQYWQLGNQAQSTGRLQNLGLFLQGRLDF